MAIWHDESHLNRYLLGREDVKLLPPAFCAAEGLKYPFEPNMILMDKSRYFDVEAVKTGSGRKKVKLYIRRIKEKMRDCKPIVKLVRTFRRGD